VLFRAAGPEKAELVGSVMGGRARIAAAFGVKPAGLLQEIQRRLRNKPDLVDVSRAEAPCQQVVLTGDDADFTKLPVHLQHGADGGPTSPPRSTMSLIPRPAGPMWACAG